MIAMLYSPASLASGQSGYVWERAEEGGRGLYERDEAALADCHSVDKVPWAADMSVLKDMSIATATAMPQMYTGSTPATETIQVGLY
jgi:hypothetical protein